MPLPVPESCPLDTTSFTQIAEHLHCARHSTGQYGPCPPSKSITHTASNSPRPYFKNARLLLSTNCVPDAGAHSFVRAPGGAFWSLTGINGCLRSCKEPIYTEEEKQNPANQTREARKAAPGSRLLWGLGWQSGWWWAMAPASLRGGSFPRTANAAVPERSDPFCGLDRLSHMAPPFPLHFPMMAAPPHDPSSPPDLMLESGLHPVQSPSNWPAK